MGDLENKFPEVAEFLTGGSEWSLLLKTVKLSTNRDVEEKKRAGVVKVAIFAFHPLASDNLLRLGRHLLVGNAAEDPASQRILKKADVYLVPLALKVGVRVNWTFFRCTARCQSKIFLK